MREADEWFEEPDELERVEKVLVALMIETDPVAAAATVLSRLTRAQAFTEGNKRTATLLALWILHANGEEEDRFIFEDDSELGRLLLRAARGENVSEEVRELLESRR